METLLETKDLSKYFSLEKNYLFCRLIKLIKAVDGINLKIKTGETLGLVGESGSGKTTLGRLILRLLEPTDGCVFYHGKDISKITTKELLILRREMQVIFQDPYTSLDPRQTVGGILTEPLVVHKLLNKSARKEKVISLLSMVGLKPDDYFRHPYHLSGGQRQRVGIARVLILNPEFIVADEPVSSLDISIQAQILNLLIDLKNNYRLTFLFIAHDISVVYQIADRIAVMYLGKIIEIGPSEEVVHQPQHPYTQALISAVPMAKPGLKRERLRLSGDLSGMIDLPSGCRFHPRCWQVKAICREEEPPLQKVKEGLEVACHFV